MTGSKDQFIRVWNPKNLKLIDSLKTNYPVKDIHIVLNENEQDLASIHDGDFSVRIWKPTPNLNPLLLLDSDTKLAHSDKVLAVAFLNNTNYLASGSADKTIKIWDLSFMALYATLAGHTNDVIII